jgi:uncharacterized membrane protein
VFTPPPAPVVIRGGFWGPLSSYALLWAGGLVIVWGVSRSNPLASIVVVVAMLAVFGVMSLIASGTTIALDDREVVLTRRFRPTWRSPLTDFTHVVENIPSRPRMPALAGWSFRTRSGSTAAVELSWFSPADRRALHRLFGDVIVNADAGLRRR